MILPIRFLRLFLLASPAFTIPVGAALGQEMPREYQEVLKYLDTKGDYKDGVLKVNLPRNDLRVSVADVPTPTAFGFGGWVALAKGDGGKEVMMGDLVLRPGEVRPVMSALLDHGLEVTALHNHFFWEDPRIAFMHIHGHGGAQDLARALKPALELFHNPPASGHAPPPPNPPAPQSKLDTAKIAEIVGHAGEQSGSVYKITVGRDDLHLEERGAMINARMGLNSWAAFVGTKDQAAVAGDVAMLESEVTPVLRALLRNGLTIVAIHNHMIGVQPPIVFLHYWGRGSAETLAAGFRAALDQLGRK